MAESIRRGISIVSPVHHDRRNRECNDFHYSPRSSVISTFHCTRQIKESLLSPTSMNTLRGQQRLKLFLLYFRPLTFHVINRRPRISTIFMRFIVLQNRSLRKSFV